MVTESSENLTRPAEPNAENIPDGTEELRQFEEFRNQAPSQAELQTKIEAILNGVEIGEAKEEVTLSQAMKMVNRVDTALDRAEQREAGSLDIEHRTPESLVPPFIALQLNQEFLSILQKIKEAGIPGAHILLPLEPIELEKIEGDPQALFDKVAEQVAGATDTSAEVIKQEVEQVTDQLEAGEKPEKVRRVSKFAMKLIALMFLAAFATACAMPVEPGETTPQTVRVTETTDQETSEPPPPSETEVTTGEPPEKTNESPTATETPDIATTVPDGMSLKDHLVNEEIVSPGVEVQTISWNGGTVEMVSVNELINEADELVPVSEINPNATMRHYVMPSVEGQENEFTAIDTGPDEVLTVARETGEYIIAVRNPDTGALEVNSVLNEAGTRFVLITETNRDPAAITPVDVGGAVATTTEEAATPPAAETITPPPTETKTPMPEATETVEVTEDLSPVEILDSKSTEFPYYDLEGSVISPKESLMVIRRLNSGFDQLEEDVPYEDYQGITLTNNEIENFSKEDFIEFTWGTVRLNLINNGYTEFAGESPREFIENYNNAIAEGAPIPPVTVHGIDSKTGEYIVAEIPINEFVIHHYIDVGPTFSFDRINTVQITEDSPELPLFWKTGSTGNENAHGIIIDKENNKVIAVTRVPFEYPGISSPRSIMDPMIRPYALISYPNHISESVHTAHENNPNLNGRNLGDFDELINNNPYLDLALSTIAKREEGIGIAIKLNDE